MAEIPSRHDHFKHQNRQQDNIFPYPPKILIVDDEPFMRESLGILLRGSGYEIHTGGTGQEGIERLHDDPFDLVLLDIGLPDMDGYQVMDYIGRESPETKVIIITGNASIESALEALRRGAYNYLRKPFQHEELLKTIENALDFKRSEIQRQRAEEELRRREEMLRLFVEHTPAAVAMFDRDMRYLAYSRRWLADYGLEGRNLIGRSHYDAFPEIPERWKEEYQRCFKGEVTKHDEEPFPWADGTVDYVRRELYPWELPSGEIGGIIVFIENITARKRAEEALRESEERFRDLVESSLIGISIVQNNQIVYQNPEHKKLVGPLPEAFDISDLRYIHPDDVEKIKGLYISFLSNNLRAVETDFRFYPPGRVGSKADMRWVQCRVSSFRFQGDEAILVNMMDITRAKTLEHLLTIKDKMVSLGRVAAGIAHEIRNPLTGINSYLYSLENLLDSETPDDESIKMMKQIADQLQVASNKIESVIKRVLDFSKPNVPRMVFGDINMPLKEAIKLSAVTLRKSGITMETDLEQALPHCHMDPNLIEQVMLNLINNAAKALEKTEKEKRIGIRSYSRENRICIRIADSGHGVPEELREDIFDPFFTTESDGSGIGLSIAMRIVTDHNGSIRVGQSKWGGAEFIVEFPIERRINPR